MTGERLYASGRYAHGTSECELTLEGRRIEGMYGEKQYRPGRDSQEWQKCGMHCSRIRATTTHFFVR
jgi:hypothetical protein